MRILYAVQGTGNGHVSRLIEMWPHLQNYAEIDLVVSGRNSQLKLPKDPVYSFNGLSLFYKSGGGLDYKRMLSQFQMRKLAKDAWSIPVNQYDLVLVDYEPLTALACHLKKTPFVHMGHQASFRSSNVPRPDKRNPLGETVLKYFAYSQCNVGFHFEAYEPWILPPVIPAKFWEEPVRDLGHTTVYLPQFAPKELRKYLVSLQRHTFHVFHSAVHQDHWDGHIFWRVPDKTTFQNSMMHSHAVLTGAGFETPSEALYLGKKLMVMPIKGQYEQSCNAAALQSLGVAVQEDINIHFGQGLQQWLKQDASYKIPSFTKTEALVSKAMNLIASPQNPDFSLAV